MKKKYFLGLIILVVIIALAFMWRDGWLGEDIARELNNETFVLVEYNGQEPPTGGEYKLTFSEGVVSGKFCNGLGGEYTINDNVLQADLVGTLMYCETPIGLMEIESVFSRLVNGGVNISLNDDVLTLTGAKGEELIFTK